MTVALVVPSCREEQVVQFLLAWRGQAMEAGVRVYIVEDGPARTFDLPRDGGAVEHLCWADAPGGMLACINVHTPGCRQIGIFRAHADGAEAIVTLDDDVRPAEGHNAFEAFREVLTRGVPVWVDPLLNYRSRGYPERNHGLVPIAFHVGSFLTIPDVDGETQLRHAAEFGERPPQYVPRPTIVPARQLIPVNGGVCGWTREVTPYVHYTVWDEELGYRRFDDIWMGIILKRLLDHCGLAMSYGPPCVHHVRASNAERNARLEANAKQFNETFWSWLDRALVDALNPAERSLASTWRAIAGALLQMDNRWARREGECMLRWREFFA
ncbi:MAG: hypothetical protein HY718_04920 [Planctomycetes bacterium]|nr:hypothetical protein [Planctomycetota bacterium]